MARIPREAHEAIRRRVDEGGEKVAAVAAAYGCTPANIYAILSRTRRRQAEEPGRAAPPVPPSAPGEAPPAPADLFGGLPAGNPGAPAAAPRSPVPAPVAAGVAAAVPAATAAAVAAPPRARPTQDRAVAKGPPPPAVRAGRPGYALLMRTSDGEEAVSPFRSLDDLLSAAKPILRTAARSPEPIWFSIRPVDLATLEDDV